MTDACPFPVVADATAWLAVLGERPAQRVLLFGAPGTGQSTLAACLARALGAAGHSGGGIGADPGSPPSGPPGAVSYGDDPRGIHRTTPASPRGISDDYTR